MKRRFAERFIDAVGSGSMEKLMDLVVHHSEYVTMTGDASTNAAKYRRGLRKQCTWFLNEYETALTAAADAIRVENFHSVKIQKLPDVHELNDGTRVGQINVIAIALQDQTLDNGDIAAVSFRIEDAVVVNSEIRVNSFFGVRASRSIDSNTKQRPQLEALGMRVLGQQDFAEVMADEPPSYLRVLKNYSTTIFHNGDLTISPDQLRLLDNQCLLVAGDLTVTGVLDGNDIAQLLVLGDVQASSVLLSETTCLVRGATRVDDALVILSGSVPIVMTATGPFVYIESEAADVVATPEAVAVCIDPEAGQVFGDPATVLDARFLAAEAGNIAVHELWTALRNGEGLGPKSS